MISVGAVKLTAVEGCAVANRQQAANGADPLDFKVTPLSTTRGWCDDARIGSASEPEFSDSRTDCWQKDWHVHCGGGMLFGSIGLGFLVYGRKQRVVVPLVYGMALMVFRYFVRIQRCRDPSINQSFSGLPIHLVGGESTEVLYCCSSATSMAQ
jgi:hypothetical protein